MNPKVLIGNADVTDNVRFPKAKISQVISKQVNTSIFEVDAGTFWNTPNGFIDISGEWINETNAYDRDTTTYAYTFWYDVSGQWSAYLYFSWNPTVTTGKLRYWTQENMGITIDEIDVDAYVDGEWVDVYEGATSHGAYVEKTFTEGVLTYVRIRLHTPDSGGPLWGYLYEVGVEVSEIKEMQEVIISNDAETTKYFAGYLTLLDIGLEGISTVYKCSCQDYTILLDKVIVNEVYTSTTDQAILQSAFTSYLPEITTATYVEEGATIDRMVCNRITLRKLIDQLAGMSAFDWYIDEDKALHYFAKETNVAPHGLSDSPEYDEGFPYTFPITFDLATSYPYEMKSYRRDATDIVNLVQVRGGTYLSDDKDEEIAANGQAVNILLPYKMFAPDGETNILVWQNDGTDGTPSWTAKTVGIDGIDTGKDVYHNQNEKLLKWASAPPNLKRAIKVHAKSEVPVFIRVRSDTSYATYDRWFEAAIVNQDLNSVDLAELSGKALLSEKAFTKEVGVLNTWQDGLRAGQIVNIVDSLRGIDGDYLIHKLDIRFLGNELAEYTVSFGEYNPDLVDMLIGLKREVGQYIQSRDDEVLNELFELSEAVAVSDGTPTATASGLYYYCNAATSSTQILAGFWVCRS